MRKFIFDLILLYSRVPISIFPYLLFLWFMRQKGMLRESKINLLMLLYMYKRLLKIHWLIVWITWMNYIISLTPFYILISVLLAWVEWTRFPRWFFEVFRVNEGLGLQYNQLKLLKPHREFDLLLEEFSFLGLLSWLMMLLKEDDFWEKQGLHSKLTKNNSNWMY